jgi:hypothetical protein
MDCVELFPTLSHCIETAARNGFCDAAAQYLKAGRGDHKLEKRIELLRASLESADFKKLRAQSEKHLTAGERVKFLICRKEGRLSWQMVVT